MKYCSNFCKYTKFYFFRRKWGNTNCLFFFISIRFIILMIKQTYEIQTKNSYNQFGDTFL